MPLNELAAMPVNALMGAYRNTVPSNARAYGESLLKSFTNNIDIPITGGDFSPAEMAKLNEMVAAHHAQKLAQFKMPKKNLLENATAFDKAAAEELDYAKNAAGASPAAVEKSLANAQHWTTQAKQFREAAQGKIPTDFAFGYPDYPKDAATMASTLGRFRYKPTPDGYQVYDNYDFNNESHKANAERYNKMLPPVRLMNALYDSFGNKSAMGEAYLTGKNSVPVDIRLGK